MFNLIAKLITWPMAFLIAIGLWSIMFIAMFAVFCFVADMMFSEDMQKCMQTMSEATCITQLR